MHVARTHSRRIRPTETTRTSSPHSRSSKVRAETQKRGKRKARKKRGENEEENVRETARRRVSSARNRYCCNVRRGERGALAYSARSRRAQLPQQRAAWSGYCGMHLTKERARNYGKRVCSSGSIHLWNTWRAFLRVVAAPSLGSGARPQHPHALRGSEACVAARPDRHWLVLSYCYSVDRYPLILNTCP